MKKIVYLLSILLLPLVTFADVLPEPFDDDFKNIEITSIDVDPSEEDTINNDTDLEDVNTENINSDEDVNLEENIDTEENIEDDKNIIEANVTATEKKEDDEVELHEIWEDWWLRWISFWYCNEWVDNTSETLNYAVSQWEPFKVCFVMSNSANKDVKVRIRLVDLINDICAVNETSIYNFISKDDIEWFEEINIPAWNYIIKEFTVTYPVWIQWDQWACTMFNIIKEWETQWNVATIINRAYPMKFFVWSISDIKNIIDVENIELSLDDNKDLIMNFDIKNEWNLENLVELSGTISNIFGYSKKFSIEWWHVLPGNYRHVEANLWSIPSYGWLFNINFKAFATPYFSYDISKSSIDPSLIEMKTFDFSTSYFKMPWLIIAIAIVVILLLITMFRKPKQKVVYVQQQPVQQPVQQPQYYPQQDIPQQPVQQPVQQPQQPVQNYWQQMQQPVQPQQPVQGQPVQQQPQQPQNPWNPNVQ